MAERNKQGQGVHTPTPPEELAAGGREDRLRATGPAAALDGLVEALKQDPLLYHNVVLLLRRTQLCRTGPLTDFLAQLTGMATPDER